jgi:formylglycine-generating enzyme required for sulfatase activity
MKMVKSYLLAMMCMVGVLVTSCSGDDDIQTDKEETKDDGKISVTVNGVSFKMVKVSGGTFLMGATAEQGSDYFDKELPVHQVTLSDYYIAETEVTQELWNAVMGINPSRFRGSNKLPVEQVSWNDCQTFITKLNVLTGKQFRLPTEAEWEFAARGGNLSKGYRYSGSDSYNDVAWCYENSGGKTHEVGAKAPNELGILDMSGNIEEWCQDKYGRYSSDVQTNPTGPSSGSSRVTRGGEWTDSGTEDCRVSSRGDASPSSAFSDIGLRLAI